MCLFLLLLKSFSMFMFSFFVEACLLFLFHFSLFSVSVVLIVFYFKFFYCSLSFVCFFFFLFIIHFGFGLSIYLLYSYFLYVCICCWWCCLFCFCYLSWVLWFLFSSFPFLSFLSDHTVWLTGSCLPDQIRLGSSRWEHWVQDTRPPENSQDQRLLISNAFLEVSFSTPRPGSTQLPAAPVLDISCQTTGKIGTQPYSSADRQPKVFLPHNAVQIITGKRIQLHQLQHRHHSFSPRSLHKPLGQPHLPGGRQQK